MKRWIVTLAALLTALSAGAQEGAALVVDVQTARVERHAFDQALAAELSDAPPPEGTLTLREQGGVVTLTYRDARGRTASRELQLAPEDPEAKEKLALAAANLVRDQADALLAQLTTPPAKVAKLDDELPPPVRPSDPVEPSFEPRFRPCQEGRALVFGGDLLPGVGTSSRQRGRESLRHLSLNLGGSYGAGVRGFELSIGFNMARRGVCGVQSAAGFNLTTGDVVGVQGAIANVTTGSVRGVQLGVANYARLGARVQLGVGNVAIREATNVQIGVGNFNGGNGRGLQLGVGNLTLGSAKVQIGVVNVARRSTVPVGLVSIVRDGRTTLDAWVSENGTLLSGITHGGDYVHNIYAVGFRFGPEGTRVGYTFGIGVRLLNRGRLTMDLDSLYEQWSRTDYIAASALVARLRVAFVLRLTERVSLFAAPGYAVMVTRDPEEETQATLGSSVLARDVDAGQGKRGDAIGFNTLSLGVRVRLSAQ